MGLDESQWFSLITKEDGNQFVWFAFADWLEERGDARARAARYCGKLQVKPSFVHGAQSSFPSGYDWWSTVTGNENKPHGIPWKLFDRLPLETALRPVNWSYRRDWTKLLFRTYQTAEKAYCALFEAAVSIFAENNKEIGHG